MCFQEWGSNMALFSRFETVPKCNFSILFTGKNDEIAPELMAPGCKHRYLPIYLVAIHLSHPPPFYNLKWYKFICCVPIIFFWCWLFNLLIITSYISSANSDLLFCPYHVLMLEIWWNKRILFIYFILFIIYLYE